MENEHYKAKSGTSNIRNYIVIALVSLVLVISVIQTLQINGLKNKITGNVVKGGGLDMGGWSEDEKMQYEHHGTLPTGLQKNANEKSAMVGGC